MSRTQNILKPDNVAGQPKKAQLVVATPTTGRAGIVLDSISDMPRQTRRPDLLILSVTGPDDVDISKLGDLPFPVRVVTAAKGATSQRNRALDELEPDDILVFLDDDFLMAADYLERVENIFTRNKDVVMATGTLLADGIGGRGFDHHEGARLLRDLDHGTRGETLDDIYNAYGCNMAMRMRPILENTLRFDEDLPFYSWLEDVDFSRRIAAYGRIVRAGDLVGVHLGTKTGRARGVLLGYSQISNPLYLVRKGSLLRKRARRIILGNMLANATKSLRPEPWVDRRGRLWGNILALVDLLRGRLSPLRIREM